MSRVPLQRLGRQKIFFTTLRAQQETLAKLAHDRNMLVVQLKAAIASAELCVKRTEQSEKVESQRRTESGRRNAAITHQTNEKALLEAENVMDSLSEQLQSTKAFIRQLSDGMSYNGEWLASQREWQQEASIRFGNVETGCRFSSAGLQDLRLLEEDDDDDSTSATIVGFAKRPAECLRELVDRRKVVVGDARALETYAMGQAYSLPPQIVPALGKPRIQMLGSAHYGNGKVKKLPASSSSMTRYEQKTFKDVYVGVTMLLPDQDSSTFRGLSQWHQIFGIWERELKEDRVPMEWDNSAFQLVEAFNHTSSRFPASASARKALVCACLSLTCPMYYGLDVRLRGLLREALAGEATTGAEVLQAEKLLWSSFQDELPVEIPLLYDMSDDHD